jgi:hypothetical protein
MMGNAAQKAQAKEMQAGFEAERQRIIGGAAPVAGRTRYDASGMSIPQG